MAERWVLVVGYGSIGRRHYRNLRELGLADVRLLRTSAARPGSFESPSDAKVYTRMQDALDDGPWLVVVANPTALHEGTAVSALEAGAHVLLEKPVAESSAAGARIAEAARGRDVLCTVAYCFRYHPLYRALRDALRGGRIGRPFHWRAWQASYLPAWHPWEDFRESYAARRELGGGVVRTLDHDVDQLLWTFGRPSSLIASVRSLSGLTPGVEDTGDLILRYPGELQATVHLCFAQRGYSRGVMAVGERGTITLNWSKGRLEMNDGEATEVVEQLPNDFDLNSIYLEMLREAMAALEQTPPRSAVPLSQGLDCLTVVEGALRASAAGASVTLEDTWTGYQP